MTLRRLAFLLAFVLGIPVSWADPVPEYDMKAAFLYNFALFTEWPDPIGSNFNICIFETDPIAPALESLGGKPIKGGRLTVIRLTNTSQAKQCHMLYLSDQSHSDMHHLLDSLAELPILTVAGENDLPGAGAIISMTLENKKLTFEVDHELAHRAHLALSSKMLRLAQRVH